LIELAEHISVLCGNHRESGIWRPMTGTGKRGAVRALAKGGLGGTRFLFRELEGASRAGEGTIPGNFVADGLGVYGLHDVTIHAGFQAPAAVVGESIRGGWRL